MKKHILLFFATVFSLATFAQKKDGGWDISVGATAMAPIAKNVDWDSKAWGQRVDFSKKNWNVSLGYMQDNDGFARIPALVGFRKHLKKGLHIGLDGGVTFFNGQKGQFTYVPSVGYRINKKWCLEQSILRTVKDGKHSSLTGFGLKYNL